MAFLMLLISVNLASNAAECEKRSGHTQTHTPSVKAES